MFIHILINDLKMKLCLILKSNTFYETCSSIMYIKKHSNFTDIMKALQHDISDIFSVLLYIYTDIYIRF